VFVASFSLSYWRVWVWTRIAQHRGHPFTDAGGQVDMAIRLVVKEAKGIILPCGAWHDDRNYLDHDFPA
jgi:hypothetical protein